MKKTIFHCALLLCAFLLNLADSNAYANGYFISLPDNSTNISDARKYCWVGWGKTPSGTSTAEYAQQFAVSNGVLYSSIPTEDHFVYWNPINDVWSQKNSTTNEYSINATSSAGNASLIGRAVTTDDAGNIIYAAGCGYNSVVTYIRVLPKTSARGEIIDPETLINNAKHKGYELGNEHYSVLNYYGRTDFYHVSGNLYEGNGAVWFTDGFKVVKIAIVNGVVQNDVVYTINETAAHSGWTDWNYQSSFKPYADGKYLLQNANGLFDCTIDGTKIVCTKIEGASPYLKATICNFKDHEILIYSKNNRDGQISIYDRTVGIELTTVEALLSSNGNADAFYGVTNVLCETELINENTMGIYTNIPGMGVSRLLLTATTDGTAFTATVAKRSDSNLQDATLSWTMPYQASSITLQYRKRYIKNNVTLYTNWSNLSEKNTDTTYTHSNVYWYNDKNGFYPTTIEYRAIAHYDDLETKATPLTLTGEASLHLIPKSIDWDLQEIVHYSGYQKVQLYWNTTGTGSTPKYYNVYRDGVKINPAPIQVLNYLDDKIPTGDHEYYIEAFVSDSYSEPIRTTTKSIYVSPRDPMKTTYSIEQIYNKRIGNETGQVKPQDNYTNLSASEGIWYKQAKYHRGYWYINQCRDANTTTGAGVIRLTADNQKILTETATRVVTHTRNRSLGVTMDDAGNIFLRKQGSTSSRTSYSYELGWGTIYLKDATTATGYRTTGIDVDLTECQINDNNGYEGDYLYIGRVDYFEMEGDLSEINSGAEGDTKGIAYLYVSGHRTKRSNKIMLKRTGDNTITASLVNKTDISILSYQGTEFDKGDENYAFPIKYLTSTTDQETRAVSYSIASRADYVHNLRSRGYFNITPGATQASVEQRTIYETRGRVNNAGGCTIGWNGEIFMISPQCIYSQNTGNFTVAMGDRAQYDANGDIVKDANGNVVMLDNYYADLSKSIPVAQWAQQEITDGGYSDVNCNWLYAVHGKIENEEEIGLTEGFTDPGEANCVYIYLYVPGVRFAKYRLIPNNYFPPTPVELEINSIYGSGSDYANPTKDLLRYDGTAKFGIALNNDATTIGNVNYKVDSYTYTFQDVNGKDVWIYNIKPDGTYTYTRTQTNEGGTTTTTTGKNPDGTTILIQEKYTDPTGDYETKDAYFQLVHQDLYRNTTYESTVTVSYVNVSDNTDKHNSETTIDDAIKDYTAINPEAPEVKVFEKKTLSDNDYNGNSIKDDYIASFRVELNVNPPTGNEEPVSYYEIIATDKNNNSFKITDFHLMENQSVSETTTSNIPGNYFENEDENEGKWNKNESIYGTLVWFYGMDDGTYDAENNPSNWTYTVNAVYAGSKSASIKLTDTGSNSITSITSTPTEIEDVYGDVEEDLRAYPIPAYTTLTVKASETIKSISIYNLTGSEVLYVAGNDDTTMQIDVQSLATGYYIMRVNKMNPIKIIKK